MYSVMVVPYAFFTQHGEWTVVDLFTHYVCYFILCILVILCSV